LLGWVWEKRRRRGVSPAAAASGIVYLGIDPLPPSDEVF